MIDELRAEFADCRYDVRPSRVVDCQWLNLDNRELLTGNERKMNANEAMRLPTSI